MRADAKRIKNLAETLAALLEREQGANQASISSLLDAVETLRSETADRRLHYLTAQLKTLRDRVDLLTEMARRDFLAKIGREADELAQDASDGRVARVLMTAVSNKTHSYTAFCETLLDSLIEATGAERGFVLFYLPESTEAEVVAARNFQTRNLSLEEYDFSRTLLREVLQHDRPLFLEDASQDSTYSREASVIKFEIKSIIAAPLRQEGRAIGALYLENNSHPCAFDERDPQILEIVAEFMVFYLQHAHLLPATFERDSRVFLDASRASKEIVGRDPKVLSLLEVVNRIADSPATVLVEGETGTGKELVARALHYQSARRDRPFVAINCAAIPDNLLESELFGHEKGAFTGAAGRYIGRIEQGDGGTIFLDEVSELAYPLQAKLLRFLQSNEFDRLGGSRTIRIDVRVVAATSKDLKALTEAGKFQEALFYRLNVIPVRMPALRERKGDIPLLIDFFLDKFSSIYGKTIRMERDAYEWLKEYNFPGNLRELENLIHRLAVLTDDVIRVGDLPAEVLKTVSHRVNIEKDPLFELLHTQAADLEDLRRRRREVRRALAEQEQQVIERAIEQAGGNLTEAAARLGVHRITLHKMIKRGRELK
ncbi:MAG: sigma 54-interacting transcriptional regulator [Acidobacteriota bacterium]